MIVIKLHGRFGNQLFQYAFGLAAATRLRTRFHVLPAPDAFLLQKQFVLGAPFAGSLSPTAAGAMLMGCDQLKWGNERDPLDIEPEIRPRRIYEGFFQSELYFHDALPALRRHFRPALRPRLRAMLVRRRLGLAGGVLYAAVHIRRADYLTWKSEEFGGTGFALSFAYYRAAAARARAMAAAPLRTLLIGDDPDFAAELAPLFDQPTVITGNSSMTDFALLRDACSLIISNSSFAWWAAKLGSLPSHRIIAPRFWLGQYRRQELPHGIICSGWQLVDES